MRKKQERKDERPEVEKGDEVKYKRLEEKNLSAGPFAFSTLQGRNTPIPLGVQTCQ